QRAARRAARLDLRRGRDRRRLRPRGRVGRDGAQAAHGRARAPGAAGRDGGVGVSVARDNAAFAASLVAALVRGGVTDAVVSPGSRSTPIALALAARRDVRVHVLVDERAAGFVALGLARATSRPVALLATSGTAGAH